MAETRHVLTISVEHELGLYAGCPVEARLVAVVNQSGRWTRVPEYFEGGVRVPAPPGVKAVADQAGVARLRLVPTVASLDLEDVAEGTHAYELIVAGHVVAVVAMPAEDVEFSADLVITPGPPIPYLGLRGPAGELPDLIGGTVTMLPSDEDPLLTLTRDDWTGDVTMDLEVPRNDVGAGDGIDVDDGTVAVDQSVARLEESTRRLPSVTAPLTGTPRGAVVFVWDDGRAQTKQICEMHEERGQRCTIAVTTSFIQTPAATIGGDLILSTEELLDLAAKGHELAFHSIDHKNYVTELDAAGRALDLKDGKAQVEAWTGEPCTTFVYPYGGAARNETTDREVRSAGFTRLFDTTSDYVQSLIDPDSRASLFVRTNLTGTDRNMQVAKGMIRAAAEGNLIACFYGHEIEESGTDPTWVQLAELLDLCADLGVAVVPANEAIRGWSNLFQNPDFEDGLEGWAAFTGGDGQVSVETTTGPVGIGGTKALRLQAGSSAGGNTAHVVASYPARAGERWEVSLWGKASFNDLQCRLRARAFGLDGQIGGFLPPNNGEFFVLSTAWQRFTKTMVLPVGTTHVNVEIVLQSSSGGDVLFKQVEGVKIPPADDPRFAELQARINVIPISETDYDLLDPAEQDDPAILWVITP